MAAGHNRLSVYHTAHVHACIACTHHSSLAVIQLACEISNLGTGHTTVPLGTSGECACVRACVCALLLQWARLLALAQAECCPGLRSPAGSSCW